MGLTGIGLQKTPGRPTEITFAANTGLPNPNQTLGLIGHMGAATGSASGTVFYTPYVINNVADSEAGALEANAKFGAGSEIANMVIAAIQANEDAGNANFPQIVAVPLNPTDTAFGTLNAANVGSGLAACDKFECEFLVSPYDGTNQTLTNQLIAQATKMSAASRVQNGQYGTVAVAANLNVIDPSTLFKYDTQFFQGVWLRDTAPVVTPAILAAQEAAILGQGPVPFNPVDSAVIGGLVAPVNMNDWITVGAGLESESALNQGWTPIRVLPNGAVAIVRSVTSRLTVNADGVTPVGAYYDVQDFQVLYFFRKTVVTRFNQTDLSNIKASENAAKLIRSEVIRLASAFEDQGMFQNVEGLSPQIVVQRNASDRSRFDVFIPVNVVPGLHVIATNIQATTEGDVFSV